MKTKIPDVLFEAHKGWVNKRKRASQKIKLCTDDWVEAQKNIIKIDEAIAMLGEK